MEACNRTIDGDCGGSRFPAVVKTLSSGIILGAHTYWGDKCKTNKGVSLIFSLPVLAGEDINCCVCIYPHQAHMWCLVLHSQCRVRPHLLSLGDGGDVYVVNLSDTTAGCGGSYNPQEDLKCYIYGRNISPRSSACEMYKVLFNYQTFRKS